MPSDHRIENVLDKLEEMIQSIGDKYEDRNTEKTGMRISGEIPDGIRCSRGGNIYAIFALEGREHFLIVQAQDLAATIASQIAENEDRDGVEQPDAMERAFDMLDSVNEEQMDRFDYYLRDKIASEHTASHMLYTERGAVRGFTVERKIFPYSESFGIESLDRSIQAVVAVTWRGSNFIYEAFDIDTITKDSDVELDYPT